MQSSMLLYQPQFQHIRRASGDIVGCAECMEGKSGFTRRCLGYQKGMCRGFCYNPIKILGGAQGRPCQAGLEQLAVIKMFHPYGMEQPFETEESAKTCLKCISDNIPTIVINLKIIASLAAIPFICSQVFTNLPADEPTATSSECTEKICSWQFVLLSSRVETFPGNRFGREAKIPWGVAAAPTPDLSQSPPARPNQIDSLPPSQPTTIIKFFIIDQRPTPSVKDSRMSFVRRMTLKEYVAADECKKQLTVPICPFSEEIVYCILAKTCVINPDQIVIEVVLRPTPGSMPEDQAYISSIRTGLPSFQQINLQLSKNAQRPHSRTTLEFRKDTQTLDKLMRENQYLKTIIAKLGEKAPTNRPSTAATTRSNTAYLLKEMIATEKAQIVKLDEQITALKKQTWSKKNPEVGAVMQKQTKVLETRLDKGTHKLNQTLAHIKDLRSLIDNLRRQKAVFQSLYHKLQKELHEKRKEMANIIEKANYSYEERDRTNQQIQTVKEEARKQTFDFEKQLKELSMLTEKSKIGQYSVSTRRPLSSQQTAERPRTAKKKESSVNIKRLQKLRDDFKKIESATQIANFSELTKTFMNNQEQNFKTFRILNQKAHEIDDMEEELSNLNKELKQLTLSETQPDKRMEEATKKLQSAERKQNEVYAQHREASKNLASLLNYVQKMHSVFNSKKEQEQPISQTTVMAFLQKIEQKAAKICRLYKELGKERTEIKSAAANHKQAPKKEVFMFDNYMDDQEQYDKILTHQDFMKKANQRFAAKQSQKNPKEDRYRRK